MNLRMDLEQLFYLLLRDATAGGELEKIVRRIEERRNENLVPVYSNEYLEGYARELASRLLRDKSKQRIGLSAAASSDDGSQD